MPIKLSLTLFAIGTVGIMVTSIHSTFAYAKSFFIFSSLLLGGSVLAYLFADLKKGSRGEYQFLVLLFLVSIVKVLGIYLKYGIYMGADAFVEYSKITWILDNPHITYDLLQTEQAKTPLSAIYVAIVVMFTGIAPLSGSFNLVHLLTNAILPVGVYILIRNSFNIRVAILGAFLLAYHPTNTVLGLSMTRENVALVFFILAVILIIKQLQAPKMTYLFLFSVLSLSIILSHYTTAYFSAFILAVIALALFSFHINELISAPKDVIHLFTPLIFLAFFIPFLKQGWYPGMGPAEDLFNRAMGSLLRNEVILAVFFLVVGFVILPRLLTVLQNKLSNKFLYGIGIGLIMVALVIWLKLAPLAGSNLHYHSLAILMGTSPVELLYKIYAFFFVGGSLFCVWKIIQRSISKEQGILAVGGIASVIMAVVWVVSDLSVALGPHRALRFSAIIGSVVVAILVINLYRSIKTKRIRLAYIASILIVFAFPITAYVTDYMAFYTDAYPSKLHDNMYNIRGLNEIRTFNFMSNLVPGATCAGYKLEKSPMYIVDGVERFGCVSESIIVVEFNRAENLLNQKLSYASELMSKEALLASKTKESKDSSLFLRKSLFKYGQYIQYPDVSYFIASPQVVELTDEEFNKLKAIIEGSSVLYSQDGFILVQVKGS